MIDKNDQTFNKVIFILYNFYIAKLKFYTVIQTIDKNDQTLNSLIDAYFYLFIQLYKYHFVCIVKLVLVITCAP